jgi:hypothetical protein
MELVGEDSEDFLNKDPESPLGFFGLSSGLSSRCATKSPTWEDLDDLPSSEAVE